MGNVVVFSASRAEVLLDKNHNRIVSTVYKHPLRFPQTLHLHFNSAQ
jgi:hypothetical protein